MELVQLTDEALLHLVAQKDATALAVLYDRHAQTVYNIITRIVREPASADELLQDTFWQIWRKASEFHGTGAVAAWLYRIARNKSIDQLRRQKARPQLVAISEEQPVGEASPAHGKSGVEQTVVQASQQHDVRQALASIPSEQRHSLELAYFEGLSQRQIADHLQVPVGTIKTRIRLGLEKLERLLGAAGYGTEDLES